MNKVELLAPAGNLEKAKMAIDFNANAIYLGGKKYSLRARANNFSLDEIKEVISYAHKNKAKVYLVTNILCHNGMTKDFKPYIKQLMALKPDGFICADPYIMNVIHTNYPNVDIHVSTQQSICNSKSALWWHKSVGATRVVTAREVDFINLAKMTKALKNKMEVEYFVHGALCVGYSGHCMMSNNLSLRDANVGGCAHSCRWNWELKDKNGKLISKKFTMSTKDICHVCHLSKLIEAGIASFKVEGRMKSLHYIATICNNYSHALKDYYANRLNAKRIKMYENDLAKAANRDTSFAWFNGQPTQKQMLYRDVQKPLTQNFAFIVDKKVKGGYDIISKNFFTCNNTFEVFGKNHDLISNIKIISLYDVKEKMAVDRVNKPMYHYIIKTKAKLDIGDIGRITK
ncbi:MAG: U32 family peptidase [Mycoplasma sp.]|nr:U32 family peptidase [Candidatus Hennigella equi]